MATLTLNVPVKEKFLSGVEKSIEELERVIKKPKLKFHEEQQKRIIATIKMFTSKITVEAQHKALDNACRDKTDIKFATVAKADYITSGDLDLLDMKEYNDIKIINAKNYLDIML